MLRCAVAALVALCLTASLPAASQGAATRNFPASALRGELAVGVPPDVQLNGQPARLAPGARIRGENNLLATPASLSGRRLAVHYTREATTGMLLDVWVLTVPELARKPWPTTEAEAKAWRFDPAAQTWTRP